MEGRQGKGCSSLVQMYWIAYSSKTNPPTRP